MNIRPTHRSRRNICALLALFCGLYLTLCGLLAWESVRPKHDAMPAAPQALGMAFAAMQFQPMRVRVDKDVELRGWYVPAGEASNEGLNGLSNKSSECGQTKGVVICCHGVDSTRLDLLPTAKILHDAGYAVVLFDFRARGESGGSLCTLGYREVDDALAVIRAVQGRSDARNLPIGLLGESMGGAVALTATARCPDARCVIAESPYASLDHAVANHFHSVLGMAGPLLGVPTRLFGQMLIGRNCADIAPVREIARIAPRSLLLIADGADTLCPPKETQALYQAAGEPKTLRTVEGATHIAAQSVAPGEYARRITAFFDQNLATLHQTANHTSSRAVHNP